MKRLKGKQESLDCFQIKINLSENVQKVNLINWRLMYTFFSPNDLKSFSLSPSIMFNVEFLISSENWHFNIKLKKCVINFEIKIFNNL